MTTLERVARAIADRLVGKSYPLVEANFILAKEILRAIGRGEDTRRINALERMARKATPGGWWSVNYDGLCIREDAAGREDDYAESSPSLRKAIDNARRSERRGRKRD